MSIFTGTISEIKILLSVTAAARSTAPMVLSSSNTNILGSNPARGTAVQGYIQKFSD
jgi:hypothetical protein